MSLDPTIDIHQRKRKVGLGIIAGISTGVFWGIPFLAPQMLPQFTSVEISFGRFFFFGVISLFFLKSVSKIFWQFSVRDRVLVFALSASGFWFYSTILFWGIHQTDGIISSLILGLLPVSIPLFTPGRKGGGPRFYLGLIALIIGLFNLFAFPVWNGLKVVKSPSLIGVASLFVCLGLWTWFAIMNSKFLKRNPGTSRKDFASLMGVISLISILPVFLIQVNAQELLHRDGFQLYLFCSMALGFGASWLANWLWNICSFHCPSEISGPLIVSETIFGLLYSFFHEARFPHSYEAISIVLCLIGVFFAVTAQIRAHLDPDSKK